VSKYLSGIFTSCASVFSCTSLFLLLQKRKRPRATQLKEGSYGQIDRKKNSGTISIVAARIEFRSNLEIMFYCWKCSEIYFQTTSIELSILSKVISFFQSSEKFTLESMLILSKTGCTHSLKNAHGLLHQSKTWVRYSSGRLKSFVCRLLLKWYSKRFFSGFVKCLIGKLKPEIEDGISQMHSESGSTLKDKKRSNNP